MDNIARSIYQQLTFSSNDTVLADTYRLLDSNDDEVMHGTVPNNNGNIYSPRPVLWTFKSNDSGSGFNKETLYTDTDITEVHNNLISQETRDAFPAFLLQWRTRPHSNDKYTVVTMCPERTTQDGMKLFYKSIVSSPIVGPKEDVLCNIIIPPVGPTVSSFSLTAQNDGGFDSVRVDNIVPGLSVHLDPAFKRNESGQVMNTDRISSVILVLDLSKYTSG